MTILYTPGQLMSAFSLSKQQWRTLKATLPELNVGAGHAPCFSAVHFLAVGVVKSVTETLNVSASLFSPLSSALFNACSGESWPQLERSVMTLSFEPPAVVLSNSDTYLSSQSLLISLPLRPIIGSLREKLLDVDVEDQRSLVFPPMVAGGRST